jgi:hypothetical protein
LNGLGKIEKIPLLTALVLFQQVSRHPLPAFCAECGGQRMLPRPLQNSIAVVSNAVKSHLFLLNFSQFASSLEITTETCAAVTMDVPG